MPRWWLWLAIAGAVGLIGGYHDLTHRAVTRSPGILVADDPIQTSPGADPPHFRKHDAEIVAVAKFRMEARILGIASYRFDRMADLVPKDFAFGWGPMSDSSVLEKLTVSQDNRFYFWMTREFPIPRREIETHSANMHLIPASDAIRRRLDAARVGQVVALSGYLVNVKSDAGWSMRSSLTR
ncbi:MAG: hypothetical protein ABI854_05490, partial [Betaproteobacteria bacterium]